MRYAGHRISKRSASRHRRAREDGVSGERRFRNGGGDHRGGGSRSERLLAGGTRAIQRSSDDGRISRTLPEAIRGGSKSEEATSAVCRSIKTSGSKSSRIVRLSFRSSRVERPLDAIPDRHAFSGTRVAHSMVGVFRPRSALDPDQIVWFAIETAHRDGPGPSIFCAAVKTTAPRNACCRGGRVLRVQAVCRRGEQEGVSGKVARV